MTLVHLTCSECATRLLDTASKRPHEVLTASEWEAALFRLAHNGHDGVREAALETEAENATAEIA